MDKSSENLLKKPVGSVFFAAIDQAGFAKSIQNKCLKTLVDGKVKAAIEGMGYTEMLFWVAWKTFEFDFEKPELVLKEQLKKIHAYPFTKLHDSFETVKFAEKLFICVNVLFEYGYESNNAFETALIIAVRKLKFEPSRKN